MNSTRALKSLRGKKLKSQQDIANKMGITRQSYNAYENDTSKCELDVLFEILNILEATDQEIDEFLFSLKQDYLSYNLKPKKE